MPVILKNFSDNNSVSGIWEITESEEELTNLCDLTDYDKKLLNNSQSLKRHKEILATRALIKALKPDITIEYNNKKPVCNKGNISISHSGSLATIIWHPLQVPAIDIEQIREKILKVSNRVFSENELQFADNDLKKLTLLWNCKECIFKIANNDEIEFKTQIKIHPFSEEEKIICELKDSNNIIFIFKLNWFEIDNYTCVWGISD